MGTELCRYRITGHLSLLRCQPCFIPQRCYMSWKSVAHNSIVLHFYTTVKLHTSRERPSPRSDNGIAWRVMPALLEEIAPPISPDQ